MTITKTQENGIVTLSLDGRLDTTTAPKLQDALISAFGEAREIMLDFKDLKYVSSAGLRVLLMGQKTAESKGDSMTLINVSEEITEVFDMMGFSDMLTIE